MDLFGVTPLEHIKQMSGLEFLSGILDGEFKQPSIHHALDFRLHEITSGAAVFVGIPSAAFLNPMGTVHGGYISALLDSAMACAAHSLCPAGTTNTTVEMKLNFDRPVLTDSGQLFARGTVINAGRTITTTEGRLENEAGKLFAHGTQTCMRIELS